MSRETFYRLHKIRNEMVHGHRGSDDAIEFVRGLGIAVPENLAHAFMSAFGSAMTRVPRVVLQTISKLLESRSANIVCDPWAGIGELLSVVCEVAQASKAYALTQNQDELSVGRLLEPEAEWQLGSPLRTLGSLPALDIVASVLPFGAKSAEPITLTGKDGKPVELHGEFGQLVLASAASRLASDGLGLFVVTPAFFLAARSIRHELDSLGLNITAALSLPSGTFAPYTNIPSYLIVVSKRETPGMFVAELTNDAATNAQIISNFLEGKEGAQFELGRYVAPDAFTGIGPLRLAERLTKALSLFGFPAIQLSKLAIAINLGRHGEDFHFRPLQNAIFIPLIGNSDVLDSLDDATLKHQNYAQVAIDSARSDARFVARYLNSELGKEIRESGKSGTVIPKLNKQALGYLSIFVPDLQTQKVVLQTEAAIAAEQNTLLSLQNELGGLQRELWNNPRSVKDVDRRLATFSSRLPGSLKQHAEEGLDQWCETIPFPLASICRAWQATESKDYRAKYEHLLHLFEATAEFLSVILLSAFTSNDGLFAPHKQKLIEEMKWQNLSFTRATFGTWKLVVEYLGKQTRSLLAGDQESRSVCAELFADQSLQLPEAVARKEAALLLSATNKMRNDWSGHGGVVGQDEAMLRNEQLLGELNRLREAFADLWKGAQLVHALHCRPRQGLFENEIEVLMGSNSEFLKETRAMPMWLDVDRLYICTKSTGQALKLLPLVQCGPSPQSAKNACYFFNRIERDGGARFISYHFIDKPELTGQFDSAAVEAIKLLTDA